MNGLDAVSQSFVETAEDVEAVRSAASDLEYYPLVIAKIERSRALKHVDEILTARRITRFRLPVWIAGISRHEHTCQQLQFSYGVYPHYEKEHPENWRSFAGNFLKSQGLKGDIVILTERPSAKHPGGNNRMEILDLKRG